ncbi:MAG: hypothetical protein ACOX0A_00835 [Thermoguttaceae bacterium]|jgi:hypothetical protein
MTRAAVIVATTLFVAIFPFLAASAEIPPRSELASTNLEDEFFELMWLCDSPLEAERDAALEELTRRFDEFEPIWQDRTFLTNGEVADEASRRFALAEAGYRASRIEAARASFDVQWRVQDAVSHGELTPPTRDATARVIWREPLRFVWLSPDFRFFFWRAPDTFELWRPRSLFSAPELFPGLDADRVDLDFVLEPSALSDEPQANSVAFDALIGVDPRPWRIPVTMGPGGPEEYRSVELTLRDVRAEPLANDRRRVSLRLKYDAAFDAFASHRAWYDATDFHLLIAPETRVAPLRLRVRDRVATGERIELEFESDAALDEAFRKGAVSLECRLPRFFIRTRIVL